MSETRMTVGELEKLGVIVKCANCEFKGTANELFIHMLNTHGWKMESLDYEVKK